jgi:hypothetical protein
MVSNHVLKIPQKQDPRKYILLRVKTHETNATATSAGVAYEQGERQKLNLELEATDSFAPYFGKSKYCHRFARE